MRYTLCPSAAFERQPVFRTEGSLGRCETWRTYPASRFWQRSSSAAAPASDSNANGADSKAGSPTVTPAPPGKYLTLPAPCRAVPRGTLKDLLPGAAELPGDQQEKVFRGSASVTYDTDRKVGCSWKSDAPNATRSLSIDFERVVSYDPAVSDDDRADTVYAKKEKAAGLSSSATPGPDAEKNTGTPGEKEKGKGKGADAEKPEDPAGDATASADPSSSSSPSGGAAA